jgi:hypothetical protein
MINKWTLERIALEGEVVLSHDKCQGLPGDGYTIEVFGDKRNGQWRPGDAVREPLIGTTFHGSELREKVGPVMAASLRERVHDGTYISVFSASDVMALRGEIAARIDDNDWSHGAPISAVSGPLKSGISVAAPTPADSVDWGKFWRGVPPSPMYQEKTKHAYDMGVETGLAHGDELEAALREAMHQLHAWHVKYGEHNPAWLPPAGDVALMERVSDLLGPVGANWNDGDAKAAVATASASVTADESPSP